MTGFHETTLVLVRHGETDWDRQGRYDGSLDIRLNAAGRAAANAIGRELRRHDGPWTGMVTSPLSRALETAQVVADTLRIKKIVQLPELVERGYGEVEGLTIQARLIRWPDGDWPGLEPYDDLQARALGVLMDLGVAHPGGRLVVVTHGALINSVLAFLSDATAGTGKTTLHPGSLTTLVYDADGLRIESFNQTLHLPNIPQ